MIKAYKTELDPNNKQRTWFEKCVEAARFVYNVGLREWKRQYQNGEKPSEYSLRKQFNAVKYDYAEHCSHYRNVISVPYAVTEAAFARLGNAYENFLEKRSEPPVPKKYNNSFQLRGVKVKSDRVRVTGRPERWIRLKERDYIPTSDSGAEYATYAIVSRRAGRWFISVVVKNESSEPLKKTNGVLGIDVGIHAWAVFSDGKVFDNQRPYQSAQRKLNRLNKEKSRRKRGGKNWEKTIHKIQKLYYHIANIRQHYQHQISNYAIEQSPSLIVLEDLNVKGMMQNDHLAKAIADVGWGELARQVEYKAKRVGIGVLQVDRFYPSSKTCSGCGGIKDDLDLSDRIYQCEHCGLEIDRDLNAAINLAVYGQNAQTERDCSGS